MQTKSSESIGQTFPDGETSEHSALPTIRGSLAREELTLSAEVIRAKKTATAGKTESALSRRSDMSSSVLLMHFARELWFERILPLSDPMLPGLGGDLEPNLKDLITWCCPSDCGRVALGLTIDGIGCSCSPKLKTPCARDWKGKGRQGSLPKILWEQFGGSGYPNPAFYEAVQGFPDTWTELDASEMP